MGFIQCRFNSGIFHKNICKCLINDNEQEVRRIVYFSSKDKITEYENRLKRIVANYEDFSTFQDSDERKEYLDAKEQWEILQRYK